MAENSFDEFRANEEEAVGRGNREHKRSPRLEQFGQWTTGCACILQSALNPRTLSLDEATAALADRAARKQARQAENATAANSGAVQQVGSSAPLPMVQSQSPASVPSHPSFPSPQTTQAPSTFMPHGPSWTASQPEFAYYNGNGFGGHGGFTSPHQFPTAWQQGPVNTLTGSSLEGSGMMGTSGQQWPGAASSMGPVQQYYGNSLHSYGHSPIQGSLYSAPSYQND